MSNLQILTKPKRQRAPRTIVDGNNPVLTIRLQWKEDRPVGSMKLNDAAIAGMNLKAGESSLLFSFDTDTQEMFLFVHDSGYTVSKTGQFGNAGYIADNEQLLNMFDENNVKAKLAIDVQNPVIERIEDQEFTLYRLTPMYASNDTSDDDANDTTTTVSVSNESVNQAESIVA